MQADPSGTGEDMTLPSGCPPFTQDIFSLIRAVFMQLACISGIDRPIFLTGDSVKMNELIHRLKAEWQEAYPVLKRLHFVNVGDLHSPNLEEIWDQLSMSGEYERLIPSRRLMIEAKSYTKDWLNEWLQLTFGEDEAKRKEFREFVEEFRELVLSPASERAG